MTFTGTQAAPPPNLSLKARLAWSCFFENGWAVVKTQDGAYITTDEALDLDTATVFPDEDALISWLEATASDHLSDDPVSFLRLFTSIPELITENIAMEMAKIIASED